MQHTDGIDISHWQGDVDFSKASGAGIRNIILKFSQKSGKDSKFDIYYQNATKFGINLGCYIYNVAKTVEEAKTEAEFAAKCMNGKQMQLGVWLDLEDASIKSVPNMNEIIHTEATILRNAGYKVGIHCSHDWYLHVLDVKHLTTEFPFWIARYANDGTYKESLSPGGLAGVKLWQYSSKQQIPGIAGSVDANHFFVPAAEWWNLKSPAPQTAYTHTQFVKDVQQALGIKPDGIAGPITLGATVTVSQKTNNRHAVVKPIQLYLNNLGYKCGTADGIAGPSFDAAVKAFQKAKGCVVDGEITANGNTWKKLFSAE